MAEVPFHSIVGNVYKLLKSKYGLDCTIYAPIDMPRLECKASNGSMIVIAFLFVKGGA